MSMKMRHWAIVAGTVITGAAMFNNIGFEQLVPFYGFITAIIVGDKAISMRKNTQK